MTDQGLNNAIAYIMGTPADSVQPGQPESDKVEPGSTVSDSVEQSRLSFRLSAEKRIQLDAIAKRRGMDLSNLVRSIVYEYLDKR